MKISLRHTITSIAAGLTAILVIVFILQNPGRIGSEPLVVRALLLSIAIIAILVAVYPANIYMALNPELFPSIHSGFLYFRLPLQFLFLYWAYSVARF